MKPTRYIIALLITVSIMCLLVQHDNQNYRKCETISLKQSDTILGLTGTVDIMQRENEQLVAQVEQLAAQVRLLQEGKQDKPNRGGGRGRMMEVTAYWEGSCGKAPDDPLYGITASGEYVQEGFIAAGPELAIGTKVYIPYFDKTFTVMDRGGMIDNGCIDVYVEGYASCMKFGRRELEVWLLQ